MIFLVSILAEAGPALAVTDGRVDGPTDPTVAPLVDGNAAFPKITSLVESYYGPGVYPLEVSPDREVSVINRWCAKTEDILTQNLGHITFSFTVNGRDILSKTHNFSEVDQDENGEQMFCHGYRGVLGEWPSGVHHIQYGLTINAGINDGWGDYPAGQIVWEFDVQVSDEAQISSDFSANGPQVTQLTDRSLEKPHIGTLADNYDGPGVYFIETASNTETRVFIRWCSRTKEILDQNLQHVHFSFDVNGRDMLDWLYNFDEIHNDYVGSGEAAYCYGYRGLLSDWPSGQHKIHYALQVDEQLDDGWEENSPGEHVWEFMVTVPGVVESTNGAPSISVSLNTNCRKGPGKAYEITGELRSGETASVVGRYLDGDYWVIIEPRFGRECWLWGNYATVTGDINQLKVYIAPALPSPTPTPTPVPDSVETICFCNASGDHISALHLFNDDTDTWMGELGEDGKGPGFCNCYSTGGPYPLGDYAVEYKICSDGPACTVYGDSHMEFFEIHTNEQYIDINP